MSSADNSARKSRSPTRLDFIKLEFKTIKSTYGLIHNYRNLPVEKKNQARQILNQRSLINERIDRVFIISKIIALLHGLYGEIYHTDTSSKESI